MSYCDYKEVERIIAYIERDECEEAQKRLNKYQKNYPRDLKIIGLQIKIYNEMHDYKKAMEYGSKYVNVYYSERNAYKLFVQEFAITLIHEKKENQAEGLLLQAIKITEGEVPKLIKQLSNLYTRQNNFEKALVLYDTYTKESNEITMNSNKVKILYKMNRYLDCIELATKVLECNIDDSQRQKQYYYIAESYNKLGDYESALINYEEAINNCQTIKYTNATLIHNAKTEIEIIKKKLSEGIISTPINLDESNNKRTLTRTEKSSEKYTDFISQN